MLAGRHALAGRTDGCAMRALVRACARSFVCACVYALGTGRLTPRAAAIAAAGSWPGAAVASVSWSRAPSPDPGEGRVLRSHPIKRAGARPRRAQRAASAAIDSSAFDRLWRSPTRWVSSTACASYWWPCWRPLAQPSMAHRLQWYGSATRQLDRAPERARREHASAASARMFP
eukprot:scaffold911_cov361-Prasinococcus_capsulatus_cf.AAC.14